MSEIIQNLLQKLYELFIFPTKKSYQNNDLKINLAEIIYMSEKDKIGGVRPVLQIMNPNEKCQKNMIYFHGNGEDLGISQSFMIKLSESLNCNIYAIEYPSYGSYEQSNSQKQSKIAQIKLDSILLYNFLINDKNILPENLSIFGRSIGTGPACYLAKHFKLEYIVLMSPYIKLKELCCILKFLKKDFNNQKYLSQSKQKNPILFIHGENDRLIKPTNSEQLFEKAKIQNQKCKISIQPNMTHNDFDFLINIEKVIKKFVEGLKSESNSNQEQVSDYQICDSLNIKQNYEQKKFPLNFEY